MATILMAFSLSVVAESESELPQENNGHPDYLIKAGYDFTEGRGKYDSSNRFVQSSQGDNGNNGKKNKHHADKKNFNEESSWYKPWSWSVKNPDKVDDSNPNSNRQSDPDSTRGQARAEERHDDKNLKKVEHPWYDPRGWFE